MQKLKKPTVTLWAAILLGGLIAFYLFYYQLPEKSVLTGSAGASSNSAPGAGYVIFYQHPFYGGYQFLSYSGRVAQMPYFDISSIFISEGMSVLLYDQYNFFGRVVCLTKPDAALANYGMNDLVRSVIILDNPTCQQ